MNRLENQAIHLRLLAEQTGPERSIKSVNRPPGGWLHTVRQALGLSLKSVAETLKLSPQAIHQVEKSEANGTISLKQLEAVAGAMGCRLVYVLVPRDGLLANRAAMMAEPAARRVQVSPADAENPGGDFPMALR